ncbi:Hypothetical predicted protein [Prunus dulcis]|uniref:Uncharacterized protein n=1 Tax=Prunus dulcis TaxID=3755 RepID=A0A5E4EC89_PRUDU|nr:Hypothetical predicted protein [Prunus dulcis]
MARPALGWARLGLGCLKPNSGTETSQTSSSLPGTQCVLCNSENSTQERCCYAFFTEVS